MIAVPYKLVRPDAIWHFVLYDRPRDYPQYAVVRGWIIAPGTAEPMATDWTMFYESVAQAQRELATSPHLVRVPREPNDDPAIVESWV